MPVSLLAKPTHLDIMVPDLMDTDLKGPVQSVELDVCINVSGKHTKELREYDKTGNLLKTSEWNSDGKLVNTTTYFYDDNGCYNRQLYIDFEDKRTNDWEIVLNLATHQIAMRNKRDGAVAIETFSPEKYLLSYRLVDKDKQLIMTSRSLRSEDNRRTEYTRFDEENRPLYTYYFKWKENGFIDMERQRYRQENKERLHTYDYLDVDEQGNWTQQLMVRYDIGGKEKEKVYEQITLRKIEYFNNE